jgi:hypothetical protein
MTVAQLEQDLRIARDFKPLSAKDKSAILALAAPEAADGRHELFKSTQTFDGAAQEPARFCAVTPFPQPCGS